MRLPSSFFFSFELVTVQRSQCGTKHIAQAAKNLFSQCKNLAEILSFFWYSHCAETMQICCVCSRQLLAHSCPKPMLRHVRSWRKPTFRVLTSRLPGQVMELGRKAQFSVAPDGRLHSGHQSAGPEEILGEPPLLLRGAKTISSLPADCELPHICFRPARVKIMAEANPGDRMNRRSLSCNWTGEDRRTRDRFAHGKVFHDTSALWLCHCAPPLGADK
jgi:hypothetical protein